MPAPLGGRGSPAALRPAQRGGFPAEGRGIGAQGQALPLVYCMKCAGKRDPPDSRLQKDGLGRILEAEENAAQDAEGGKQDV